LERERRDKARQERFEENERRRKEWEEKKRKEEAERVPFEAEVQMCDFLLSYLGAQLKVYQGSADKKKQQRSNRQRMYVLCNPPDIVQIFDSLSLSAPILQSDLASTVSQVEAKKGWYLSRREKEIEEKKTHKSREGRGARSNKWRRGSE